MKYLYYWWILIVFLVHNQVTGRVSTSTSTSSRYVMASFYSWKFLRLILDQQIALDQLIQHAQDASQTIYSITWFATFVLASCLDISFSYLFDTLNIIFLYSTTYFTQFHCSFDCLNNVSMITYSRTIA